MMQINLGEGFLHQMNIVLMNPRLYAPQPGIDSIKRDQALVFTLLNNLTMIHDLKQD
jgi:hypothetical protein